MIFASNPLPFHAMEVLDMKPKELGCNTGFSAYGLYVLIIFNIITLSSSVKWSQQ
jgi:hypothetical protein